MQLPLWKTHTKLLHMWNHTQTQLFYLLTNIIHELVFRQKHTAQIWHSDEVGLIILQLLSLK